MEVLEKKLEIVCKRKLYSATVTIKKKVKYHKLLIVEVIRTSCPFFFFFFDAAEDVSLLLLTE